LGGPEVLPEQLAALQAILPTITLASGESQWGSSGGAEAASAIPAARIHPQVAVATVNFVGIFMFRILQLKCQGTAPSPTGAMAYP
jgi:hypothetical protein